MFTTPIDTNSSAVIAQRVALTASTGRTCGQGWLHADIAFARRSLR